MRLVVIVGFVAAAGLLISPAAAAAATNDMIASYAYAPNPLRVTVGETVTWTNEDAAPHTVTSASGPHALKSPELQKGQSWSFTFTAPGTYAYYCAVHPTMRAVVDVSANTSATPTSVPGTSIASPTLITTTTSSSPGGPHINPLLFLLAVVAGVVVVGVLATFGAPDG